MFSAHSLPEYTVNRGDLYSKHIREHINIIVELVKPASYSLGYQSKTRFMKWLSPSVPELLDKLIGEKTDNVIVVPISFVSDHIETLIELDEIYIKSARNRGMDIIRSESLNDSDDFVKSLIDIIMG